MPRHPFYIDKITNSIEDAISGKSYETEIVLLSQEEVRKVHKKDGWFFNWKTEFKNEGRQLFKLVIHGEEKI